MKKLESHLKLKRWGTQIRIAIETESEIKNGWGWWAHCDWAKKKKPNAKY